MSLNLVGQVVGRYRLDEFIGEGGMGRVYRGFDPTLGRAVAIKLLPEKVADDRDRLDRFVREARTASALNHPNVVTIYEIGSAGSHQYIAMELLEGDTLRDRLTRGKLELRRAIDTLAQIADGVAAAHASGVIHRDLKPENVVITKAGFVKILDFGLAKLREAPLGTDDGATQRRTDPGTVLGSVGYMSPEQAAGREVDHRTDIFSLGCMLFEAVTGRRAFTGDSSIDTLHKILHDDPPPLRDFTHDVPQELQRITRKCMAKDPDERYQSAKDVAIDLRMLRRDLDSQPKTSAPPDAAPKAKSPMLWIAAVLAAAIIAAAIIVPLRRRAGGTATTAPQTSVSRITASGNVIGAAISPNGEYIAYAYSDAGKHSLFLKQIATGSALELVPPATVGMWGVSFAPDSRSVYYAMKMSTDPGGSLYSIPILGGTPRKLLSRIDSSVTFSPDGKQLAFTRINEPSVGHSAMIVANADGSGERRLAVKNSPELFAPIFWGAPAWSPDGKLIATAVNLGQKFTVVGIPLDGSQERVLTADSWTFLGQMVWLHDMRRFIIAGRTGRGKETQLFSITYPEGQRTQLTNDLFEYRMVTTTADDSALVTVAADQTGAMWYVPTGAGARPTKLSSGKYDGIAGVAAGEHDVVFVSRDNGKADIFSIDREGKNRRQINPVDLEALSPTISPDGQSIAFASPRERNWAIVRINRDGSNPVTLCEFVPVGGVPGRCRFSPDGKTVMFTAAPQGNEEVFTVPSSGGKPSLFELPRPAWSPALSPDGRLVAYFSNNNDIVIATAAGQTVTTFHDIVATNNYSIIRWSTDGKSLLHNAGHNDRKNVWIQPLDGSPAHALTSFDDQYVLGFDTVPGTKDLVVVRGTLLRDAVLIKNFH